MKNVIHVVFPNCLGKKSFYIPFYGKQSTFHPREYNTFETIPGHLSFCSQNSIKVFVEFENPKRCLSALILYANRANKYTYSLLTRLSYKMFFLQQPSVYCQLANFPQNNAAI